MLQKKNVGLLLLTFGFFMAISLLWVHPVAAEGGAGDPNNGTTENDPNSGTTEDPNGTTGEDPNGVIEDPNGVIDPNSTDPNGVVDPNAGVDPNEPPEPKTPYMYIDAGGPYQGTVGVPITFDGGNSFIYDGNNIDIYYWDWHLDKHFDSSYSPQNQYTWLSAYSGPIRLYVFDPNGHVDWDEAHVSVEGPDNTLLIEVSANADLHVRDIRRRHVGLDYRAGLYELEIPDAEVFAMDAEGNEIPFSDDLVLAEITQLVGFPLYSAGPYEIELIGLEDGPFTMTVYAFQDGQSVALRRYTGEIFAGETISTEVSAAYAEEELTIAPEELSYTPER
jgi:hypothetical protein